eukprot:TRINITY_DN47546_c0_g1_i1.p1 TRINITY_DN47546_c0_g1~~TRINITY_DN47546_c0_g1_i1.p1  ORF type:complete len:331 (-),score=24.93 TRINITY_DN47546_c0_g1_i1:104-991(-)
MCVPLLAIFLVTYDPDPDWNNLKGKTVVICGASTGVGEQMAYHCSQYGASLLLVARRENVLQRVKQKSEQLGATQVQYLVADLSAEGVEYTIEENIKQDFGGEISYLILNHIKPFYQLWNTSAPSSSSSPQMATLSTVFNTNTFSYIKISQALFPLLEQNRGGIGVVSSIAGRVGVAYTTAYSASKHALHGFFNSLRQDLALTNSNVSITLCTLGSFSTSNAIANTEGKLPVFHQWSSPMVAAKAIVGGTMKRRKEIWVPWSEVVAAVWGSHLAGEWWEWLLVKYHQQGKELKGW